MVYYIAHELPIWVEDQLKKHGKCLIIDCHSFSNTPFKRDLSKRKARPDIDIGVDNFHTPKALVDTTTKFFKNNGLSCKINNPYAGSIVPLKYYSKNVSVQSIMIEVNRNLYLEEGTNKKNKNYAKIKQILHKFIEEISKIAIV